MNASVVANIVATVAFAVAALGALLLPVRKGGLVRRGVKFMLAAAMAIYAFVCVSHILQFGGLTDLLDIYENYLKVLFIPLIWCAAYAMLVNDQLGATQRSLTVMSAEHEMLMSVVDATPTGIAVLDLTGRIEFANDNARRLLTLAEDPDTGRFIEPDWVCTGGGIDEAGGPLACCVRDEPVKNLPCTVRWPDGRLQPILVSSSPVRGADGTATGAVIAMTQAHAATAEAV